MQSLTFPYHFFTESINSACPFEGYRCDSEERFNVRLTPNMLFEQVSSTALRLHNFLAIAALTEQSTLSLDPLERGNILNLLAVLI